MHKSGWGCSLIVVIGGKQQIALLSFMDCHPIIRVRIKLQAQIQHLIVRTQQPLNMHRSCYFSFLDMWLPGVLTYYVCMAVARGEFSSPPPYKLMIHNYCYMPNGKITYISIIFKNLCSYNNCIAPNFQGR